MHEADDLPTSGFADPVPMAPADLEDLIDLDATIESAEELHVETSRPEDAQPLSRTWRVAVRPLDEPRVDPNRLDATGKSAELHFHYKQVAAGVMDGVAWILRVGDVPLATLLAVAREGQIELLDLRVDYDERRQGFGSALLCSLLAKARQDEAVRAVVATVAADNVPAHRLLSKLDFGLAAIARPDGKVSLTWRMETEA